jgi:hypothetical protein
VASIPTTHFGKFAKKPKICFGVFFGPPVARFHQPRVPGTRAWLYPARSLSPPSVLPPSTPVNHHFSPHRVHTIRSTEVSLDYFDAASSEHWLIRALGCEQIAAICHSRSANVQGINNLDPMRHCFLPVKLKHLVEISEVIRCFEVCLIELNLELFFPW